MREIKFMAVIKKTKKVLVVSEIMFGRKEVYVYTNENKILTDLFSFDDVKIIQYIGIKDKNKKEIYDGDIFKYNHHKGYNVETFIGSIFRHDTLPKYITKPRDLFDADEIEVDVVPYLEVIGNIHQNPEVLKSNDQ